MERSISYLVLVFSLCFISVAFGAMSSVLAAAYLPEILRDLGRLPDEQTEANIGAWINFSFLFGGTVGGILLGFLSDRVGGKSILIVAVLLFAAGSGLGVFASHWVLFAMTRFLVGCGVGAALVVTAVIISQAWSGRSIQALGLLSVAYPIGIVAAGLITSSSDNWKYAFLIGVIPALIIAPILIFVKETSISTRDPGNKSGGKLSEHRSMLIYGILVYGTMLIGLWAAFSWLPTWVNTLSGEKVTDLSDRGNAVMLLGLGALVGGVLSGWISVQIGMWRAQAICFIVCFGLCFFLFKLTSRFNEWVLIGSALLGFFFGVSQGALNALIPSLFPAQIRASATGLCFHAGRIFTAIAVFFVGAWAIALGGYGNAIFTFSAVYIIGLMALLQMQRKTALSTEPSHQI